MSLQPQVLSIRKDANTASLDLLVSKELDYFRGHFPNLPILPGVVQVDWAIRFAQQHLDIPADRFVALKALKFSAPVRPDTRLDLQLHWRPESNRLDFAYTAGTRKYASGQAVFSGVAPQ
jgi:3-hydroxymyristoyl/3-hydroxydecanoyl-(acyl carrier protein) dehydratase